MAREVTSKHIEGITDLVVIAPIREGFIDAYENVTYETRARIVIEALHNLRVSAREYESKMPFSDIAERILDLLNYRIGIIDKDLFQLDPKLGLTARRYIFLAVTFDGPWEPYMRLVWRPLGYFLDLVFCNCEGYRPAFDSSFSDYARWVRANQVESAIFYATTGLTLRDQIYLRQLERLQRENEPLAADQAIARLVMQNPMDQAALDLAGRPDLGLKLGLEALTVLYRLADYYPPDQLIPDTPGPGAKLDPVEPKLPKVYTRAEGRYLLRAARSLLDRTDFEKQVRRLKRPDAETAQIWGRIKLAYGEELAWYYSKADLDPLDAKISEPDPERDDGQVQAGILKPIGTDACPVRHGALLLMTVNDAVKARAFLKTLKFSYEGDPPDKDGIYATIGFTVHGLRRIGLHEWKRKFFPKEFREGMERRAGLLGDYRDNHPRNWTPPLRNGPDLAGLPQDPSRLPPVEMAEVDFIIQLRYAAPQDNEGDAPIRTRIREIAEAIEKMRREDAEKEGERKPAGVVLAGWEPMVSYRGAVDESNRAEESFGHFNLRDGLSQPVVRESFRASERDTGTDIERDPDTVAVLPSYDQSIARGELLCGYANDRGDSAPPPPKRRKDPNDWTPDELMFNGSFLVIRKLQQNVTVFEDYLARETKRIATDYGVTLTPDQLKAYLVGRDKDGKPQAAPDAADLNAFDYRDDKQGERCPLGAHVRRANPREAFMGRPAPRLMRRGMSYGPQGRDATEPRGVIFMAYCASIAEQYEVIQRWLNGGNSTGQTASQNDPLLGVRPEREQQVYRFIHRDTGKVIRTTLPAEPFVELRWGTYLFIPSRASLDYMITLFKGWSVDIDNPGETRGRALIAQFSQLPAARQIAEWRRVLDDFDSKDPAERDRAPDIWSAIRYYHKGSYRIDTAQQFAWDVTYSGDKEYKESCPVGGLPRVPGSVDKEAPSVVLVGSQRHVKEVLSNPEVFSVDIQAKRMGRTSGDIYVAMQPGKRYAAEATETNRIMFEQDKPWGFAEGYKMAKQVLGLWIAAQGSGKDPFKIELRRDFITPTLGRLCTEWFGVPEPAYPAAPPDPAAANAPGSRAKISSRMVQGGWSWAQTSRDARCPGDFLAPSRNAFYPVPNGPARAYAAKHGPAILAAGRAFVGNHPPETAMPGTLASQMADAIRAAGASCAPQETEDLLARNIIGMMIGMLPPLDGNLRGILYEWLTERLLWRYQGALLRSLSENHGVMSYDVAKVLYGPISRAMCKRPSPDLLYRRATKDYVLKTGRPGKAGKPSSATDVHVRKGDIVIVSLVSAAQRSLVLENARGGDGDISYVFGGERDGIDNGAGPFHACPAQEMMMGTIVGMMAALLTVGRIKAMPSSLIIEISDWL